MPEHEMVTKWNLNYVKFNIRWTHTRHANYIKSVVIHRSSSLRKQAFYIFINILINDEIIRFHYTFFREMYKSKYFSNISVSPTYSFINIL